MINIIICFLLIINLFLIYKINKKKIKTYFLKSQIPSVGIEKLDDLFKSQKIDENLYGPKKDAIIKSFCISSENNIVGMTSDYEAWIIGCLSKISKNIFEFGTCSGKTTYIMALNSNIDSKVVTLTLDPNKIDRVKNYNKNNKISFRNIINESVYKNFLFTGKPEEKKIEVIFQNSINFDEKKYLNYFDLIFIDGGHTYAIVKNDTEKAFRMLTEKGLILWHDYVLGKTSSKDIVKYLNEISNSKKIFKIKNTSICFFKNNI